MKRTSVWLDEQQTKQLKRIGKKMGNLKVSQVIRMAIAQYLEREAQ
jgi:metal-responsive CopG/Arc/MetJ family transcriptional regulator